MISAKESKRRKKTTEDIDKSENQPYNMTIHERF